MYKKISLFFLRVSMGWLMFYAGIVKILDPDWSSAGYLKGAQTFSGLYQWLLRPEVLPIIDLINGWGLTLLGVSLLLGVFVGLSAPLGALLMFLYYFPVLAFPYVGHYGFLVDDHVIYALVLVFLAAVKSGNIWGLAQLLKRFVPIPILKKII